MIFHSPGLRQEESASPKEQIFTTIVPSVPQNLYSYLEA